ncbi:hypothetical protein E2C01_046382 [Portunus trituberculatus]|uniref:Uncharacterized protein n=1 Tax=Portunus trituberculatus TaxID=210409 RepID=A0A5B7FYB3_PORTR|nr:hypothetical protein [Portunus trituberculatus]
MVVVVVVAVAVVVVVVAVVVLVVIMKAVRVEMKERGVVVVVTVLAEDGEGGVALREGPRRVTHHHPADASSFLSYGLFLHASPSTIILVLGSVSSYFL